MIPLVSVVTVCLNAEQIIEKTIESVMMQDTANFEYLIIDGKSKDRTVKIAEKYQDKFQNKGISYRIYSEKDTGIYNAMNKATQKAIGKYIIFMNAGDIFYSSEVLNEFEKILLSTDNYIAVYGNTVMKNRDLYHSEISVISNEEFVLTHQSVFTLCQYLKKHPYDESYRYAADSDYYMRICKKGFPIKKVNRFVSIFDVTGVSASRQGENELKLARKKNGYENELPFVIKIRHEIRSWMPVFITRYYDRRNGWTSYVPQNFE